MATNIFELFATIGLRDEGFRRGVEDARSNVEKTASSVNSFALKVGAGVGSLAIAATAVGMKYESAMSQVAATMGIAADKGNKSFVMLSDAAKEAGASTKFSASQAADALNYLALAGYDAEKSVQALPKVLALAAAGGMDLAYTSDLVTDSMSALSLETKDLEMFTDQMAKASQKSNTSVAQLGEAILTVGGTAKTLVGGVTEMNTVLGLLADNGVKGSEGGTALRNVINSLTGPTDKAVGLFKTLGLEIEDASTGKMRPMKDIIKDLDAGLNDIGATAGSVARADYLNQIFKTTDLKSVNALIGTSSERWDSLSASIENSAGATAKMAATMQDNLQGVFTTIGSQLEGLGIQFYEKFQEPLRAAFEGVSVGLTFLSTNLDGILAILTPVTAGFAAFAVVVNIQSVMAASARAIDLARNALIAAQAATTAMTVTLGANATAEAIRTAAVAAGMTVDVAGNIITTAGTIATAAETAALLASTGAITAKTLMVGVLSGKIGIATAAQLIWNAAMNASHIGLMIAGVALLTTAIVNIVKWIYRESEGQKELKASTKSLKEENDGLLTSVKDSGKAYEDSAKNIIANASASELLANRVFALAEQENKSAGEKAKLAILIDQLNESMPGLNVLLDEEGNIIGQTAESVYSLIEAKKEEAKQQAATERAVELAKEQIDIEMQLNEIKKEQAQWDLGLEDKTVKKGAYAEASKNLAEQEAELQAELIKTSDALDFVTETTVKSAEAQISATDDIVEKQKSATEIQADLAKQREETQDQLTQAMIEAANAQGITLEEYEEQLTKAQETEEEISKKRAETLKKYTDSALDMFSKIETKSKISVTQMANNMEHNQKIINQFGDNLLALKGKVDEGLLNTLRDAGPESAATVQAMVNANDKELQRLNDVYKSGSKIATDSLLEQLGLSDVVNSGSNMVDNIASGVETNESLKTASQTLIVEAKAATVSEVGNSNFVEVGQQIINGIVKGITGTQSKVFTSLRAMAQESLAITRKEFDQHSPSKEFEDIFKKNMEGAVQGVTKNKKKVVKSVEQMAKESLDGAKLLIKDYQNSSNYMASEELKMLQFLSTQYKAKSKERIEVESEIKDLQSKLLKEQQAQEKDAFEHSMNWITVKKKLGMLSYTEEMAAYERMQSKYAKGTEYREKIDIAAYERQKKNTEEKMKLFDEQEKITDKMTAAENKYQKAIDDRTQAVFNSFVKLEDVGKKEADNAKAYEDSTLKVAKLKEEITKLDEERKKENLTTEQIVKANEEYAKKQTELSEATKALTKAQDEAGKSQKQLLMETLSEQVTSMEKWAGSIEELTSKGIDDGLLKSLQAMGPSAQTDMQALNDMTETELKNYQTVWQKGQQIARKYATDELSGMKKDMIDEVKGLTDDLNKLANTDYVYAGENTMQGFIDGIKSKFLDLKTVMTEMSGIVSGTVETKLEMHSPSKLFERFAGFTVHGYTDKIKSLSGYISDTVGTAFSGFDVAPINPVIGDVSASAINSDNTSSPKTSVNSGGTIINQYLTAKIDASTIKEMGDVVKLFNNFAQNSYVN